ncbi:hypothetical protein HU200_005413 [Digitaria exilis]|uniref:Uncharacterized protein n=1 Tax=Digitaria exilis TaxID=1010633 RepID=A0A835FTA8_9POAL|nr:hypothetical protein HU200_005413 [Digitaria exilis]
MPAKRQASLYTWLGSAMLGNQESTQYSMLRAQNHQTSC